jgi:hypothetical protein
MSLCFFPVELLPVVNDSLKQTDVSRSNKYPNKFSPLTSKFRSKTMMVILPMAGI